MPKRSSARKAETPAPRATWLLTALICLGLAAVTLAVYLPVRHYEFLNYDDPDYVSQNPMVQRGVSWESVKWAFTHSYAFNWHPITWISHMLDCQFFGLNAGAHHLVNLGFHLVNTLLLFLLFRKMTRAICLSAFVAGIFALHPLHVESVAWVCERKDVLSTFFWFLTTLSYLDYVQCTDQRQTGKGIAWYLIALLCFALGLMSKAMLVTLPFTLLLLDFWPLQRIGGKDPSHAAVGSETKVPMRVGFPRLLIEKVPFLLLAIASSAVTFLVQRSEGAVANTQTFSVGLRIANAFISYVRYLGKTIWPKGLMIFYPYPETWPAWQVAGAVLLLIAISTLAIWKMRRLPFLFVGWFWFLGTLVPVIGLVQVGLQSMADRYMYVPMIGLSIVVAWGFREIVTVRFRWPRTVVFGTYAIVISACAVATHQQLRYWRNSITVFEHAIDLAPDHVMAHVMAGNAYNDRNEAEGAIHHYSEALKRSPNFAEVYYNLGNLLIGKNQLDDAIRCYEKAIQLKPDYVDARANLAYAFSSQHKTAEALVQEEAALKLRPDDAGILRNIAVDLMELKRWDEAEAHLVRAIELKPDDAAVYKLLGDVLMAKNKFEEAVPQYRKALELQPAFPEAQQRLDYVVKRLSEKKIRK